MDLEIVSFVLNQEEDEVEEGADQSRGDATSYVTVLRYAGLQRTTMSQEVDAKLGELLLSQDRSGGISLRESSTTHGWSTNGGGGG